MERCLPKEVSFRACILVLIIEAVTMSVNRILYEAEFKMCSTADVFLLQLCQSTTLNVVSLSSILIHGGYSTSTSYHFTKTTN